MTLLKLKTLEHVINESIHYPVGGYSATYSKTYIEKLLGVERPRLNETSVDPDILKDISVDGSGSGDRSRQERSFSQVMKNWDWELGAEQGVTDPNEKRTSAIINKYL